MKESVLDIMKRNNEEWRKEWDKLPIKATKKKEVKDDQNISSK